MSRDLIDQLSGKPENDIGNAQRFIARHGTEVMFVAGIGWMRWDGRRWAEDAAGVRLMAQETVAGIKDEASRLSDNDAARRRFSWALQSGKTARISAMLTEAEPHLMRGVEELNPSPTLLNVANGTLDLRAGVLVAHEPENLITRIAPIDYDPEAEAPTWQSVLERFLPDAEVRNFLWRWAGYTATGLTSEQAFLFAYGTGGNGKTTITGAIQRCLGDYAANVPFEVLAHDDRRSGNAASPELARLAGARMVIASEPDLGTRFSESLIKQLTGGDVISARRLYHEPVEFRPAFKLCIYGNHRPGIRGGDHGIWRRVLLMPFEQAMPDHERIPLNVMEERLDAEAAGILTWITTGARQWFELGLMVPEIVRAATDEYRTENDPLSEFLTERTIPNTSGYIQAKTLFTSYEAWCEIEGQKPMTQTLFGRMMAERGYKKERVGVVLYKGLELRNADSSPQTVHSENHHDFRAFAGDYQ